MIPRYYINDISYPLYYFQSPPYINAVFTYQDVNKDFKLREIVTNSFLNKYMKKHPNSKLNKTDKTFNIIYSLIRKYIKHNNINWYDLEALYEDEVIQYLHTKLSNA
jgi:hypothetical protein